MISIAAIRASGVLEAQARAFAPHLAAACERFDISTKQRIAGFLAQASHESAGMTRLEENLNYTTPARIRAVWPSRFKSDAEAAQFVRNPAKLANRVYSNKLGNGDEASGDGARFLGRGLLQLTGRSNYAAASDGVGIDYKARPELVALPEHAALTAAWFWAKAGCNGLMDAGDIDGTTRRINGPAMLGAQERRDHYHAVLAAL